MANLIAEIGWNHMGNMDLAKEMIRSAADSGAHFAKFQSWKVKRLQPGEWDDDGRRQIYENAELSESMHQELISYCNKSNIKFMSSIFALEDGKLLHKLNVKDVKIPSFECANHELIDYAVNNFDTVLVSTGTANESEIHDLAKYNKFAGFHVMHCVSSYPCEISQINLPRINKLKKIFPRVGFSDHTSGCNACKISLEFSPTFIEKHFTVDHELPGRDNKFAILPSELKDLSEFISNRNQAFIDRGLRYQDIEVSSRENYRGRFNKS